MSCTFLQQQQMFQAMHLQIRTTLSCLMVLNMLGVVLSAVMFFSLWRLDREWSEEVLAGVEIVWGLVVFVDLLAFQMFLIFTLRRQIHWLAKLKGKGRKIDKYTVDEGYLLQALGFVFLAAAVLGTFVIVGHEGKALSEGEKTFDYILIVGIVLLITLLSMLVYLSFRLGLLTKNKASVFELDLTENRLFNEIVPYL